AFQSVDRCFIAQLVGHGGQQAVTRVHDLGAGVEDQEAAGAVGVLRGTRGECRLAEGCSLLVTQDACNRNLAQQLVGVHGSVDLGGGTDFWHHRARHAEVCQDLLVPLQGLQVHEQGAGSIGHVGDVHAAVNATGQVPQNPAVGGAEEQVSGFGTFASTFDIVQDPLDLGTGEVGGQRQAHGLLVAFKSFIASQLFDDVLGAGVLPDNGVVDGLAGVLIPYHRGFALDGDADDLDVVTGQVGLGQRLADHFADVVPDFSWIM